MKIQLYKAVATNRFFIIQILIALAVALAVIILVHPHSVFGLCDENTTSSIPCVNDPAFNVSSP